MSEMPPIIGSNGLERVLDSQQRRTRNLEASYPIGVYGVLSANQNIGNATFATLSNWSTLNYLGPQEKGIVWNGVNGWTIDKWGEGWWHIHCTVMFASGAGSIRAGQIQVNGAGQIQVNTGLPSGSNSVSLAMTWESRLTAGQVITFAAYQDSGGTLAVMSNTAGTYYTWYTIRRIGR